MGQERVMIIDGNSLLYRAFYALPLLRNRRGTFTNAVYGFLNMLSKVLSEYQPSHIIVAFDKDRRTLRSEEYGEYKIHRPPAPPELREQFGILREVLEALNVSYIEMSGYEADDIIGTLSVRAGEQGLPCIIVTGDQDELQLVSPGIEVLVTKKGISEMERYDLQAVHGKWEVSPYQLPDVKGLMGDASDNIPGVPGIGRKTAIKLVKQYGSLEGIYANLNEITPVRLRELLTAHKDQAFLSRKLATIVKDVPLEVEFEKLRRRPPQRERLVRVYQELEFNSLLKDLDKDKPPAESPTGPVIVGDAGQVLDIIRDLRPDEEVSLYLLADYHHPMWAKPKSLFIANGEDVYVFEVEQDPRAALEKLRAFLENEEIGKLVHNGKFIEVVLKRYGLKLQGVRGDTLLLSYVLDPGFSGETLSEHLFHYLGEVVDEKMDPGLAVRGLKKLHQVLEEKLGSQDLVNLYKVVELPLSPVLADMEFTGIKVDPRILAEISQELALRIAEDQARIYQVAGQEFNINSTRQLGKVLFEDLGLPPVKKTKTGYSTSAEVLEELYGSHEIIEHIVEYRTLAKLKSTYVDTFPGYIHPETGRVHTVFKQAVTATGRLSSVEPNLQNIPIRMEEGRRIRKAFVPGDEDHILLSCDYSQIDLRSLAHMSGDENLIETFRQGIDIHQRTASEIFKVPLDQVTPDLRRKAKAVNFGIVYGISDFGLARGTGVTREEAKAYIERYLDSYPGVRRYMQEVVAMGREKGYVSTVLGRRRYLPDLLSSNRTVRSMAERMALNAPIQGTSADIIKLAMLSVYRELKRRNLRSRMLLQVHDDLVFEVPLEELEEVALLVRDCMENAFELKVPLEVEVKVGANWYDMKRWEISNA
ncbi:MAG: DNA polymerase I [Syntrophothermus sp.]|uniref:DNA polymerase I n=1 Tax=Syntrophothermus sp. TaxID=2736299 RepID=UPI00257FCC5A|nr:DNA polymerase I [Syntrophothermus sp.]NSW83553.1 DNA polymerase I [Syntrophothermus sp.]